MTTPDDADVHNTDDQDMPRTFLLIVDSSSEMRAALRFACRRAVHTDGNVALFHAVEPADFHHFATIGELMESEARSEAEKLLQRAAADVQKQTGRMPIVLLPFSTKRSRFPSSCLGRAPVTTAQVRWSRLCQAASPARSICR
jgi:hypothetical protein